MDFERETSRLEEAPAGVEEGMEEEELETSEELQELMRVPTGLDTSSPEFTLDPAGLRQLLWGQPDVLEEGLSIHVDGKGKPVGAGFTTGVGDIDLLAQDRNGGLVVVMVSEGNRGEELVAEVLQRIGWVRKHLGRGKQKVRGIVLMEEPPENLSYAAAAVADTVAFKTFRVTLAFDDVEIS